MPFKVQILTPDGHRRGAATCISRHWKEEYALQQVEDELPTILARAKKDMPNVYAFMVPKAFIEDMLDMFSETSIALKAQDAGGAYMRWRDFADFWEEKGISVADWWGDIIVERQGVDKFYFYPTPKKQPER
jgi:hypothetical protein